ncbi:hypothetical protein CVT26_010465 [Gymnopilus dilepis]|uniref:Uncharacterized protein n=1 Tax=Gymnopilus dilepis TaxID=231916 RepID=A0A409Y0F7_9AGAR|nr:hypothetical protein CVT26_010465 [Gymnopilus dilepis]
MIGESLRAYSRHLKEFRFASTAYSPKFTTASTELPSSKNSPVPGTELPSSKNSPVPGTELPSSKNSPVPGTELPSSKNSPVPGTELPSSKNSPVPGPELPVPNKGIRPRPIPRNGFSEDEAAHRVSRAFRLSQTQPSTIIKAGM